MSFLKGFLLGPIACITMAADLALLAVATVESLGTYPVVGAIACVQEKKTDYLFPFTGALLGGHVPFSNWT